jgi:N-acetylglucosaminyldiphosphoundecaprenol N-acetyl-beta-D-mannosaminyltransferase
MPETLATIEHWLTQPHLHQIATANPEFVMRAQADDAFRAVLEQADLCLPDGVGLVWASRWLGRPFPERVAGSELVYHVAELCAAQGASLFLLGAAEGVAAEAGRILQTRTPALRVAGTFAGSPALAENDALVQMINESGAAVLYVAYGAPAQDMWIARNRHALPHVRVAIGVGGALDFISGRAVRAPRWVQRLGLEWLHRLWREPWRWRRMLALPRFVWAVVWGR